MRMVPGRRRRGREEITVLGSSVGHIGGGSAAGLPRPTLLPLAPMRPIHNSPSIHCASHFLPPVIESDSVNCFSLQVPGQIQMSFHIPAMAVPDQASNNISTILPPFYPMFFPHPQFSTAPICSSIAKSDADSSTSSSSGGSPPTTHDEAGLQQQKTQKQKQQRVFHQLPPPIMAPPNDKCPTGVGVRIELANKSLWEKFHSVRNEMVVTRSGRKMFPKLELQLHGLEPKTLYAITLQMRQISNYRYKYQGGEWSPAGQDDSTPSDVHVFHHDGPWNTGEFWSGQEKICFDRVKLTNRDGASNAQISLSSMHKYQPVVCLYKLQAKDNLPQLVCSFEQVETQFIAVTAYQNEAVINLKVEHNPFAKGFREGSSRKRTLSPPIPEEDRLDSISLLAAKRQHIASPPFPSALPFPSVPYPLPATTAFTPMTLTFALASMAASSMAQQQQQFDLSKMYAQLWQPQMLLGGGNNNSHQPQIEANNKK